MEILYFTPMFVSWVILTYIVIKCLKGEENPKEINNIMGGYWALMTLSTMLTFIVGFTCLILRH